jgi:hypothetical protein
MSTPRPDPDECYWRHGLYDVYASARYVGRRHDVPAGMWDRHVTKFQFLDVVIIASALAAIVSLWLKVG